MVAVTAGGWLMVLAGAAAAPDEGLPVQSDADTPPSREMLLYLAEFEDSAGEWVDPMSLDRSSGATPVEQPAPAAELRAEKPEPPR